MELVERVEALEREMAVWRRRATGWRIAALAVVVAGLVASCRSTPPPTMQQAGAQNEPAKQVQKEVRSEMFMVVDSKGVARALLGATEKGATFMLMDSGGKSRVTVAVPEDGAALLMAQDKNEKPRAMFGMNAEGKPIVSTIGADGKVNDLTAE